MLFTHRKKPLKIEQILPTSLGSATEKKKKTKTDNSYQTNQKFESFIYKIVPENFFQRSLNIMTKKMSPCS